MVSPAASSVDEPAQSVSPALDLSPQNGEYIEALYQDYRRRPESVDAQWRAFFQGVDFAGGVLPDDAKLPDDAQLPSNGRAGGAHGDNGTYHNKGLPLDGLDPDGERQAVLPPAARGVHASTAPRTGPESMPLSLGVYDLVHTFREFGHFAADVNPLGAPGPDNPFLDIANFGITEKDFARRVGKGGFGGETDGTLGDLLDKLRQTYCGSIGVEYTGIIDKSQRDWLTARLEPALGQPRFDADRRKQILFELVAAEEFEHYLGTKFKSAKRFSVEGAESLIPVLNTIVDHGPGLGADAVILAMAHRGRLNALAHVLNKPYEAVLGDFEGTNLMPQGVDGDVKYHLGYAQKRQVPGGEVKVSLLPNPSHLELINPIQQGIVRCKQEWAAGGDRKKIVPVTMHGDAAFVGQGIVAETLNLSELAGYETGGTIHIIVNNQIGFTTPPRQGRFTPYATDVAKTIGAPVFHVNGDDPDACGYVAQLAMEFRQQFMQDVIIDLICYRRHGHNEQDEPRFTQPLMYQKVDAHPTTRTLYEKRLIADGDLTEDDAAAMKSDVIDRLDAARAQAKDKRERQRVPSFSGVWQGLGKAPRFEDDPDAWNPDTSVPAEVLQKVVERAYDFPEGFSPIDKIDKFTIKTRRAMVAGDKPFDFGGAEMVAMGSLLLEGTRIRFTGQDVERGTFSHRHGVLHDPNTGERYTPLCGLGSEQADFELRNSMLSELAVLGFDWGYASADPRNLVVWEAQFGDFVNGAQALIDQIMTSAESKWQYMNGIVLLLPHGYEGAGPEHSNAYLERWLSLSAEDNMQIVMPSTAGQLFHLLRRQILRPFRKPLVVMTPKALLRANQAASPLSDLTDKRYQMVIDDERAEAEQVRRVIACSGKVYHTLDKARQDQSRTDVALIRVEQLYPLPKRDLAAAIKRYPNRREVVWAQEEPKNRGAWTYIEPRLRELAGDQRITYAGRPRAASPAVGALALHTEEDARLIEDALGPA
jgi:2-oxoglutarate dehydrogenase E1 component